MTEVKKRKFEVFSHPLPRQVGSGPPVIYRVTVEGYSLEEVAARMRKAGYITGHRVLIPWPPVAIIEP